MYHFSSNQPPKISIQVHISPLLSKKITADRRSPLSRKCCPRRRSFHLGRCTSYSRIFSGAGWRRKKGTPETRWCAAPKESVYHLLFEYRQWWSQRAAMYRTFEKDKVLKPMPREEEPEASIFREPERIRGPPTVLAAN